MARGETVTVHEKLLGADGKNWYAVTVDDIDTDGFMRDYVVTLDEAIQEQNEPEASAQESTQSTQESAQKGTTNRDANVRKTMNGPVIVQLRKNATVDILERRTDKNGNTWYHVRTRAGTEGYMRDYVLDLGWMVSQTREPQETTDPTPMPSSTPEPTAEPTPRPVIGTAHTNREPANVREKPASNGAVVRQLSKNVNLQIYGVYEVDEKIWYEVATESGFTHGFVRDYVITITQMDENYPPQPYAP